MATAERLRTRCATCVWHCQSPVKALRCRSGASKELVDQKSNHVGKQLRHDPRHYAPNRPSPRFLHPELILQRTKHAFDASAQAAMSGAEGRFPFRGGFPASSKGIPKRPTVFPKETREPISAVAIVGEHRTGLRKKRRLPGLPGGLNPGNLCDFARLIAGHYPNEKCFEGATEKHPPASKKISPAIFFTGAPCGSSRVAVIFFVHFCIETKMRILFIQGRSSQGE